MTRGCLHSTLAFLRNNVRDGVESFDEARDCVRRIQDLTEEERLFLDVSLHDQGNLEMFYSRFCACSGRGGGTSSATT